MSEKQNRWVQEPRHGEGATVVEYPPNLRLELTYLTDPEIHAAVLPPPLTAPPEPRVRVHFTRIEFNGHLHEIVGSVNLDAMYGDQLGQFCAVMPIDLETAVTPSRETYGEPKKLAKMECEREGDHVRASVTRQGVTIIEIVGDVTEKLAIPEPYEVVQFWYKFLPAVSGEGFYAGPFLITLHQTVKPRSCEKVDGKLVLRDLPGTPVADLPVLQQESARLMMIQKDYYKVLEDVAKETRRYHVDARNVAEYQPCEARARQMVGGGAAVIVQHDRLSQDPRYDHGRHRRDEEARIRRRKQMHDVGSPQFAPEERPVTHLRHERPDAGNPQHAIERSGRQRIDGNQPRLHGGIVAPSIQQPRGLDGVAAQNTNGGRDDRHTQPFAQTCPLSTH